MPSSLPLPLFCRPQNPNHPSSRLHHPSNPPQNPVILSEAACALCKLRSRRTPKIYTHHNRSTFSTTVQQPNAIAAKLRDTAKELRTKEFLFS
jgi:hypothetical protein